MQLRIVLDTSVLIASLGWHGSAARLFAAAAEGRFQLVVTTELLDELRLKLAAPKFRNPLRTSGFTAESAVESIATVAVEVEPLAVTAQGLRDQSDLHVLAAAVAGADIIVSRDKDLLTLGEFEGIPIVSVEVCLHTLGLRP